MKKAIVIGATSGIGRELALLLISHGYKVGLSGRRAQLLSTIKAEHPDAVEIMPMDVSETDALVQQLELLEQKLGGLDLLVISAGTGDLNAELDFDIEQTTINTNVMGFTLIADWALNYFLKQNSGHLVGITSLAALLGNGQAPAYNASKAYQLNYLQGLRQKVHTAKANIVVTDIRPGFVATAMAKGDKQFWVAPTAKAAKQIYKAIKQKRKVAYVTKRWYLIAFLFKLWPTT